MNNGDQEEYPGLFDKALEKAISDPDAHPQCGIPIDAQTPDQIAKYLACNIDHQIIYNTGTNAPDREHPLEAYGPVGSAGVQCAVNANLLRGLLRSIGVNNAETVYVWGGKPDNPDKRATETGGLTSKLLNNTAKFSECYLTISQSLVKTGQCHLTMGYS